MFGFGSSKDEQSKDEKYLASWMRERVLEIRQSAIRVSHESIWLTNIAYLLGYNGVFFDQTTRQFKPISRSGQLNRSRLHINRILPTVQNRLARLCKNPPRFEVRPNSQENEDRDAARKSYDALIDWNDRQEINKKRIELYMAMMQAGHAYTKVCYDEGLGSDILDPETGEIIPEGEARLDIATAFEIFPDPLAKTFDEIQYLFHCKVRKLDYFRQRYPELGPLVKEEEVWLQSLQQQERIQAINVQTSTTSSDRAQKGCAIEIAYYEKKSAKHPNGRMITSAGGIILEDKELPVGEIPFAKFDDVIVAGKYYSESLISHARPIQDQLDNLISKRADWTNKMLAGKVLAPKGHGLSKEAYDSESGEFLEYNAQPNAPDGGRPTPMPIPLIPQYAYEEEDKLLNSLYDIFGINQIARGQLPAAGIPAIGMQLLLEQDETRIGIETEHNEHSWARTYRIALKYMGEFYKTQRKYKKLGKNNEYLVDNYTGSDLKENHDVIVIRGSTVPTSSALRKQGILNLYDRGLVGNQQDPKVKSKVLADLEYGDISDLWKELSTDLAQIKEQITEIEQELEPEFQELDNHPLHLQEKNIYRKSGKWKNLSPKSKQLLLDDIEKHIQAMMRLSNPQLAAEEKMNLQQNAIRGQIAQDPEKYLAMAENAPDDEELPLPMAQGEQ